MKKILIIAICVILMPFLSFSSKIAINLNMNYNFGNSSFFEESEISFSYLGLSFIEKRTNNLGLGFNIKVNIPITERLYVVPGFTFNFGFQEFVYLDRKNANNNETENYFFNHYSGDLSLLYDIVKLKNGWDFFLLAGVNYNNFQADTESRLENEKYWGGQGAIGTRFASHKHFGFQVMGYYKMPFSSNNNLTFLGAQAGILYKF